MLAGEAAASALVRPPRVQADMPKSSTGAALGGLDDRVGAQICGMTPLRVRVCQRVGDLGGQIEGVPCVHRPAFHLLPQRRALTNS